MIDIEKAREIVAREGWLSKTPEAFRKPVLSKLLLRKLDKGTHLYTSGDRFGGVYCLMSGALRVGMGPNENGMHFAHLIVPITWFGEGPLISGKPRLVDLVAASPSELLYLPLHDIEEILRRDTIGWRYIAQLNLGHFENAMQAIADLMIRDQKKRFIAILLRLGACRTVTPSSAQPIDVEVNQADIATMANIARTTANTILNELHAAKLVGLNYSRIQITAPGKLRAMLVD